MPGEADDSVQGVALRRIRLFKNGDAFTPGRKLVISPRIYRNFEQLLHNLSQEINLVSGAVRKIYAIDGTPITALDEFENDQAYVAAGMEPFKKVRYRVRNIGTDENGRVYSIEELPPDQQFISDKKARQSKKPFGSSLRLEGRPRMSAKQLFGPTTKAYKIAVFVNGGQNCTKVVLNYRNCKSLDQVLALVSLSLDRRVTRLYDAASAARITGLHAISDEMVVVATSGENMRKGNYPSPNWHASGAESKRETHDKAYGLTFFPNGDAYSHGYTVAFRRSRFPSLKKLVDTLNATIHLLTGRITRIFTLDGHRIETVDELLDRSVLDARLAAAGDSSGIGAAPPQSTRRRRCFVVVAGDDAFLRVEYDVNRIKYRPVADGEGGRKRPPQQRAPPPPLPDIHVRPATELPRTAAGKFPKVGEDVGPDYGRRSVMEPVGGAKTSERSRQGSNDARGTAANEKPARPSKVPSMTEIEEESFAAHGGQEEQYEAELKHFNEPTAA